jgi:uncharacterized membrane protein YbhN (UPF0104 family)
MTSPEAVLASAGAVLDRVGALDGRFLALALALQLANVSLRALAWRNVLAAAYPGTRVPVFAVGCAYAAGAALNGYVPARGGEGLKILLARTCIPGSSIATVAASGTVLAGLDAALGAVLLLVAWQFGWTPAPALPGFAPEAWAVLGLLALATAIGVVLVARQRLSGRVARLVQRLAQGFAVLRRPSRYARDVVPAQLAAWACRIGVAFCLLGAFGLPATVQNAVLVVVVGGLSTLVPVTPGGAGTQQVLVAFALQGTVSTAAALSFSAGMQVGVTAVNTLVGLAALMLIFRTLRPVEAVRAARRRANP